MNSLRIAANAVLAAVLFAAGLYLLFTGSFFLRDRGHPEVGTLFSGVSVYLLSAALMALGAFAIAVARAWVRGDLPMPPPAYKGQLIVRYWYFIAVALACLIAAFLLADRVSETALHAAGQLQRWREIQ